MKRGFTMIELIIVIAVITIIIASAFTLFSSSRVKSRDAVREHDIKQIQNALSLYATLNNIYPVCAPEVVINGTTDCLSNALLSAGVVKGRAPVDSINSGACGGSGSYVYCYLSSQGFDYTLRYSLETNTIQGKSAGWQIVSP